VTAAAPVAVSPGRRILAALSLGSGVVLALALVALGLAHLDLLVVGVAGLALATAGAWWLVTETMPRRAVGAFGVAAGVAVMAAAVVGETPTGDRPVLRAIVLLALVGLMVGCGRAALVDDLRERDARRPAAVRPPQKPVLLCNPWSGGGKVERFGLVERAESLGVEVVMLAEGLDLEQLARDAVARGADCLGMAGGDGSQALVASIAIEHDLPFVLVSAGTRNHFALDLGIERDDPRPSLDAFRDAVERRVDYATVNGRLFVNNVSLGVYATIVQQEGYRDAKAETTRALLPELLGRTEQPFDLQFTEPGVGEVDGPFLVQVSNNPYVLGATLDASQRRRLDTGTLGIVAITAESGAAAAAVVALSALGQRRRSRSWHEFAAERFEVRSRSGRAHAGVDGEALELDTPLDFRIHPRGLRLLVPAGNLTAAEQRRARNVSVADLLAIVRGTDPLAETHP
jgi:diacylglycerol kinase family enzyme